MGEFEGETGAAEVVERVAEFRVHEGAAIGERVARFVVVEDDDIDAVLAEGADL